jgi:predicted GH43/DUF377 family glycosyl hydrolase
MKPIYRLECQMSQDFEERLLIAPHDVSPSAPDVQVEGVFNPGVVEREDGVHLLVRVAERPTETRPGWIALPSYDEAGSLRIDWIESAAVRLLNPRWVEDGRGYNHLLTVSHLRHAISRDGLTIDRVDPEPFLRPKAPYESFGVEDARLTSIVDRGGRPYFTYVAVSDRGIVTKLAWTDDFHTTERLGVIFPPENKDVVLFPRRIGEMFWALHRPYGANPVGRPEIWVAQSSDLIHWGGHDILRLSDDEGTFARFGAGTPPVEVPEGWLAFVHAVRPASSAQGPGQYFVIAVLLDANCPSVVRSQSRRPLFEGNAPESGRDDLGGVVFPTGCVIRGDDVLLYCGERDSVTTVRRLHLPTVLASLR